uniref:Putative secreted protein n=1 Tax=Anopheles triannulatus TaxID=58253 RepID=A0A2M4B749_9DIPT
MFSRLFTLLGFDTTFALPSETENLLHSSTRGFIKITILQRSSEQLPDHEKLVLVDALVTIRVKHVESDTET